MSTKADQFDADLLFKALAPETPNSYDLIVIGGGSGGISCANEAAALGQSVALFDYVTPSPKGTRYGLGGTCVNVGCIPKKLMHKAAGFGMDLQDAKAYGWRLPGESSHSWQSLVTNVQNHIRSLNFSYQAGLASNVDYYNYRAALIGPNQVRFEELSGKTQTLAANKAIVIAPGGRPYIPEDREVPGAREVAITSDDFFSLKESPGKTLVVGGSYVAVELAGILAGLGLAPTLSVRSQLLRDAVFDLDCVSKVQENMVAHGVHILEKVVPLRLEKVEPAGNIRVEFSNGSTDLYDTVIYATGRQADVEHLGIQSAGGTICPDTGKIQLADPLSSFHVNGIAPEANVCATGDAALSVLPELTPVAIAQGEWVARSLFADGGQVRDGDAFSPRFTDLTMVPSTVFSPVEYGRVGLSESMAVEIYGEEQIESYLSSWESLEVATVHREPEMPLSCLAKLVCKKDDGKVLGLHYVGPHAGEVLQGFSLAVRLGCTKEDFDQQFGIHPTDAEAFCDLRVTKSSGESWEAAGGCGGGRCG